MKLRRNGQPYESGEAVKQMRAISIQGRDYTIMTEEGEDYISSLSEYINGKMLEISAGKSMTSHSLAILTALNMADEMFKERQRLERLKEKIRKKSEYLLKKLETKGVG